MNMFLAVRPNPPRRTPHSIGHMQTQTDRQTRTILVPMTIPSEIFPSEGSLPAFGHMQVEGSLKLQPVLPYPQTQTSSMRRTLELMLAALVVLVVHLHTARGQTATLGLADGFSTFNTTGFNVQLVKDSQTLYSLTPAGSTFNFIPTDMMTSRQSNGNYHLGDITFRARKVGSTAWVSGDSSTARKKLTASAVSGSTLASANLSPTLPTTSLLNITRRWVSDGTGIQLLFDVHNSQTVSVEIGALGAPLEFNNIFTGRTAAQVNTICSLFDPYIGQDAGFVQVTPLLGTLPPLVVTPVGKSPLEGWRFLPEATTLTPFYQSQTFEGLYEWQFHTLAYAQNEWVNVTPWNAPTSFVLAAGQTRTYGLEFRVAPSIRGIETTLQANARPVAVSVPGYIVPLDQIGKLFLNYPSAVSNISVSPAGALTWATNTDAKTAGWVGYTVTPHTWGRSRLSVTYADGTLQTLHYYVTNGATKAISDLGNFLTTSQWFNEPSDPFKRSPSIISYDRSVNAVVKNDPRSWIPGLSDEAGAGSWLAGAMKQYVQPSAAGTVKKAVFYYDPTLVPNYVYPTNIFWVSLKINRNTFVHLAITAIMCTSLRRIGTDLKIQSALSFIFHRALYRVARNYPSLVSTHTWQWYINQAVLTVQAMMSRSVGYNLDGLMGETVIRMLLDDLSREGLTQNATFVQAQMKTRWTDWSTQRYPFGSEMAWDSTGQEGVYAWSKFFNDTTTATNALNSIIAYQPLIPHWGYNGNARRYWDNVYGGKLMTIERQIHHYGSGLNALPLMSAFQSSPTDYYLLRVGHAGLSGPMSNIDQGGFAAASFHSFANTLAWEAYSGDYGPNFSGLSMGTGTTIINHPDFGWQAFGGIVNSTSPAVLVQVRDAVRRRVFIAPIAALLTLDAGAFSTVSYTPSTQTVVITITPRPRWFTRCSKCSECTIVGFANCGDLWCWCFETDDDIPRRCWGFRCDLSEWSRSNYTQSGGLRLRLHCTIRVTPFSTKVT
ncbi:hypothetical protein MSAN_02462000 [Mycena sanguinolenta]|uniref:Uncharacterized protein n=1 Tax=Mycena sanguinolenta TaxID=230812 RepID=A0A8H6WWV1_9AGAR|nr:hypothetical protein MSAN_02462000 [Mycena sanguinolenta]